MKTFVPLVQWLGPRNRPMTYRFFCITQKHLLGPHTPETAHRAVLNTSSPEYKLKKYRTCSQQLTIESHKWHKSSTSLGQPDLLRLSPTSLSSPGPPKTDTFSRCPKPSFSALPHPSLPAAVGPSGSSLQCCPAKGPPPLCLGREKLPLRETLAQLVPRPPTLN